MRLVAVEQLHKIENNVFEVNVASFSLCLHWWTCCFVMPGSFMWPSSKSSHVLTCRPAGEGCHSSTYTRCWPAARLLSGWCWAAAKWLPDLVFGLVRNPWFKTHLGAQFKCTIWIDFWIETSLWKVALTSIKHYFWVWMKCGFQLRLPEDTHDSTNQISDKHILDLYCLIQLCGMVDTC